MPERTTPRVEPAYQRLLAWRCGQLVVDTRHAHRYYPDEHHPRWYVPPGDITWDHLEPDDTRTVCQYKGEATYHRVRGTDIRLWTYTHPHPETAAIAGMLAVAGEQRGVEILIDGAKDDHT